MYPMNNQMMGQQIPQQNIWGTTVTGGEMAKKLAAPLQGIKDPAVTPQAGPGMMERVGEKVLTSMLTGGK